MASDRVKDMTAALDALYGPNYEVLIYRVTLETGDGNSSIHTHVSLAHNA
jgi:hypothetical protein